MEMCLQLRVAVQPALIPPMHLRRQVSQVQVSPGQSGHKHLLPPLVQVQVGEARTLKADLPLGLSLGLSGLRLRAAATPLHPVPAPVPALVC